MSSQQTSKKKEWLYFPKKEKKNNLLCEDSINMSLPAPHFSHISGLKHVLHRSSGLPLRKKGNPGLISQLKVKAMASVLISITTVTNYSKQHKCMVLEFWGPEVHSGPYWV